jgi:hypothetical protein
MTAPSLPGHLAEPANKRCLVLCHPELLPERIAKDRAAMRATNA